MNKGFTLAEVLIALGIVGIIAVLAIPGVMKNYQNRLYTAQLEKVYAQISDATQSIMNDQHVDNFYETTARGATVCDATMKTCTSGIGYLLTNYFKTVKKNCLNNTNEACMTTKANTYQTIGGSKLSAPTGEYFIQTITGTTIGGMSTTTDKKRTRLIVDINGLAEPNVVGRDVFSMEIRENGTLVDIAEAKGEMCTQGDTSSIYTAAQGCLSHIIEAGWKMEY